MWCSRGCLGPPATSVAWLCHVSVVGGARRRGCAAGGVPVFFRGLLERGLLEALLGALAVRALGGDVVAVEARGAVVLVVDRLVTATAVVVLTGAVAGDR